jgi:protein gp37
MAENSKIEWTDHTFNPWVGCTKVSPACDHCYAEGWAKRTGNAALWNGERRRTTPANWRQPIKWDTAAAVDGRRARVFCASLADVFDNQAEPEWRADLWRLIEVTPNLDWLLLTKRPQNIAKMMPANWGDGYPNVWIGTTVENQGEADRRIPHLLGIRAKVHFLSCEPLLGPLDLTNIDHERDRGWEEPMNALETILGEELEEVWGEACEDRPRVDWVICGGESGPGAREFSEIWAASLKAQCAASGVAFFMKQMSGVRKPLPPIPEHLMVREFPEARAA